MLSGLLTPVLTPGLSRRRASARRWLDLAPADAPCDPLSGAATWQAWTLCADALVTAAHAHSAPLAVLFINLDHFDQLGRDAGDRALAALGAQLRNELRCGDLLGRDERHGFVIALPGCSAERGRQVGERLRRRIERTHWRAAADSAPMTISVGCADLQDLETALTLAERAKHAMHAAVAAGRNRVAHALKVTAVAASTL